MKFVCLTKFFHLFILQICGDDQLCLFDVAATGDLNIGDDTKETVKELTSLTELLKRSMTLIFEVVNIIIILQLSVILHVFMEPVSVTILVLVLMVIQEIYVTVQVYCPIYVVCVYSMY